MNSQLWRYVFGKPDGFVPRLVCWLIGHDWIPCDPGCCNRWYCVNCLTFGPTLDYKGTPPGNWRPPREEHAA